jgi:hypothetical protein
MWLHPAENSRFGARHQVDPQICLPGDVKILPRPFPMSHVPLTTGNWFVLLNLSESRKEVSTCFS